MDSGAITVANIRNLQRSFAGGELTPEFFGKIDDAKYANGLAKCRNFVVKTHGPVENRPGFSFVRSAKDESKKIRLIPFTFSTTQTMIIEVGAGYFRFHTMGATLLNGSVPYEVANPYAESELFDIHYVQSADVLTLVHPNHAPRELKRLGATNWALTTISFGEKVGHPTFVSITCGPHTGAKYTYNYRVHSVTADGLNESIGYMYAYVSGNLFETGCVTTITWEAAPGAARYNVYKLTGGLYGYIGSTDELTFVDDNVSPDVSKTPPVFNDWNDFNAAGKYPSAVSYFEQRRCFSGTLNEPQKIWMTRSGTESNLTYSLPTRDDDRIEFRVAAREANTIRHIVPLGELVLLTSAAEWRVTSVNSDAITPSSISVKPQSYIGASNVQPLIVNNAMIYAAARGGHIREMGYNWQAGGFVSGDLSIRSPHLFDGLEIVDMAYAKAPLPIAWFVSTSGKLLGLTYVPEHQIGAWHQHDTDGSFESCAVVAEGSEDVLYVVVRRQINGQTRRYIERMASRRFESQDDAFFVDCGATYSGVATETISGLHWLEGKTVSILADGAVHPQRVVYGGSITLDQAASKVHVGLPIEADIETLPLAFQIDNGYGQGRPKNVNRAWLRVYRSSGIFVGPSLAALTEAKQRTNEPYGSPPALKSEEIEVRVSPSWSDGGQIVVRQADPLPLTIAGLTLEVAVGG